ncbi:hypothetical protein [Prosthecobacter sp.]|uniref:hypothetical protein n=1 Tax=Prosthecobacter sp. TaxID=1965333 RepID=UPI003783A0D2
MFLKKLFGKSEPASKPLPVPPGAPFSARVATFWEWFATNSAALDGMMEHRDQTALVDLMNSTVDVLTPERLDWCFEPGADGAKHSFVLSSAGNPHRRQLVDYWLNQAPAIPGWSFFAAKQPVPELQTFKINTGGFSIAATETWVSPEFDEEEEKFRLWLWHPAFASMPQQASTIGFLMLDAVLGEDVAATFIGGVATKNDRLQTAMPLTELREFIYAEVNQRGWQNRVGAQRIVRAEIPQVPAPPYDIGQFVTSLPDLISEMLGDSLDEHDPLEQSGAAYYYIRILHGGSVGDEMKAFRDTLDDVLATSGVGHRVGFGVGPEACFYFITAFDPSAILSLLLDLLVQHLAPRGSAIYPCSRAYGTGPVVPPLK